MSATLNITQAQPLPQIVVAAATFIDTYVLGGSFTQGVVWMEITSTLDAAVQISFNGVDDHIAVPAGSAEPVFMVIDFKAFRTILPAPNIYVTEIGEPTTGNLYISAFGSTAQSI